DLAVAGRASDTFLYVDAVIEIHEIRKVVDAGPLQRLARRETRPHRFEERTVGKNFRVTVHAGLRRWNPREARFLDRGVAVAAVDAIAGDVAFVAELDRLLARDARAGNPRRPVYLRRETKEPGDDEYCAEDADAGDRVGAAMEDLRHRFCLTALRVLSDRATD